MGWTPVAMSVAMRLAALVSWPMSGSVEPGIASPARRLRFGDRLADVGIVR